jgi:hypothetical protein
MADDFERRFRTQSIEVFDPAGLRRVWKDIGLGYVRFSDEGSNPRSLDQQLINVLQRARRDGFDSSNQQSKIMLAMMNSFNDVFIDQLKAKVHRGQTDAFRRGQIVQHPGFGYWLVDVLTPEGKPELTRKGTIKKRVEIDPEAAEWIVRGALLAHGSGGRGVSCCVPGVRWRHPTHRVHHRAGADPEDPDASRRIARTTARLVGPWPADRLGRARAGPLSTGQSFRRRPTSCP